MDACCKDHDTKDEKGPAPQSPKGDVGCCEACPDKGCEGCDCSKPENTTGCCKGGGCGCENGR